MKWDWKDFWVKALIRAVRTFAQSFVSMIGVGAAFNEVDWLRALSVSGVAFVLSILTSLATGRLNRRKTMDEKDKVDRLEHDKVIMNGN